MEDEQSNDSEEEEEEEDELSHISESQHESSMKED